MTQYGYKKVYASNEEREDPYSPTFLIVKLRIHPKAQVRGPGRQGKCRASGATPVAFFTAYGFPSRRRRGVSREDRDFVYALGKPVYSKDCQGRRSFCISSLECAAGIHFFVTMEEAVNYNWK